MSRLEQIRAALVNDYDSCPELAKEDVRLLLTALDSFFRGQTLEETIAEYEQWHSENVTCHQDTTEIDATLMALRALL